MSTQRTEAVRRSIEVEYWVVDDRGRLVEPGELLDASPGVEREFVEPMVEIKTTPCETAGELRAELVDRLDRTLQRADELGKRLVPLATPVNEDEVREIPGDRTQIQNRVVGEGFQYVRHCAGTHIHVEQRPGREVDQFNTLVALDPALALVNSSPYFRGRDIATGARSKLYRRKAYEEMPHQGRLWRYLDGTDEWTRRLERRFEEFTAAALDTGVDRQALQAAFDPESAVWTPVQLREQFGTVEWRSPDTALPSQVLRLADDVATIVERACDTEVRIDDGTDGLRDDAVALPAFETVIEYVDAAIRDGLSAEQVRRYLERLGFDVDAYEPISAGMKRGRQISSAEAREIRLEYADRLVSDVQQAKSVQAD